MNKKWFTSDLHHSHRRICEFTDRKLITTQENHDRWLRAVWNNQVDHGDIVYILGDISFNREYKEIAFWMSCLKGEKIILKGNHDKSEVLNKLREENLIVQWYDYKEIKIGDKKTCLMHFPIASWNEQRYGSYMLHGHSHGAYQGQGKILDVGIDSAYNIFGHHRLFSEEDVVNLMQQKEIYIADEHRR